VERRPGQLPVPLPGDLQCERFRMSGQLRRVSEIEVDPGAGDPLFNAPSRDRPAYEHRLASAPRGVDLVNPAPRDVSHHQESEITDELFALQIAPGSVELVSPEPASV